MRCNVILNNHQETINSASKLLTTENLPEELKREAHYNMGKAFMAMQAPDKAMNEFQNVAQEVTSMEGAESKYRIAEIYHLQGKNEQAEQEVYSLVAMNTPHQYWMARSFILLADIYVNMGDDFQARHTLQSVLDNYDISGDGIIADARSRLVDIEKREATIPERDEEEPEIRIRNQ
jgi:TolA-binding protein